jgi:hypothetical protein
MAYAYISSAGERSSSGSGFTTGSSTTSGDLIVVTVAEATGTTSTVTDSKSNTYTALTTRAAANGQTTIYYCQAPTVGSSHTWSFTGSFTFPSIAMAWFSGSTTTPFDQQNGAGGSTSLATGSITPTQDNELIIVTMAWPGTQTMSVDSSVILAQNLPQASNGDGIGLGYLIQTSAAAINPTVTLSGSQFLAVAIASFKAGGSGGSFVAAPFRPPSQAVNRASTF